MCVVDDFVLFVFVFWSPTFSLVASGQEESSGTNEKYRKEPVKCTVKCTGSLSHPNNLSICGLAGSGVRSCAPNNPRMGYTILGIAPSLQ